MNTILFFIVHYITISETHSYNMLHVVNTILKMNEKNEIDNIKMFMSKEFVGCFAKIISDMIEVRYDKLFVKT